MKSWWIGLLALVWGLGSVVAEFKVGVGKRVLTPDPLLPVSGGLGPGRPATEKRGDLYARAMVLERGETRVALVAVDFLGFPSALGDRVRRLVEEIPGEHLLIGASHTHSAPDCYGFPDENGEPGCDLNYLDRVCRLTAEAVREAWERRMPARLKIATGEAKGQIAFNYYADALYDPRCSVIQAVDTEDAVIGTLVNYAIHPEVMGPKQGILSPDLMGPLWETIESEVGGMALFLNGALGGMVTADVRGPDGEHRQTWEECQRIGRLLGQEALRIIGGAEVQGDPVLRCHTREVSFPVDSEMLRQVIRHSPLPHRLSPDGKVTTQVNLVELGNARLLTIPGEALPNIGYYLKRKMGGEHQMLLGLTNDAFGYILTKYDWNSFRRYDYITRTCLGEMTGEIFVDEALEMVRGIDAAKPVGALAPPEEAPQPWIGVGWEDLDSLDVAVSRGGGVRVVDLAPQGPAQRVGLRRGDVVTHWNGAPVRTEAEMRQRAKRARVGEKVALTLKRGQEEEEKRLEVVVGDRASYFWPEWRPGLPTFGAEATLTDLFESSDEELDALKQRFETLQREAAKRPN